MKDGLLSLGFKGEEITEIRDADYNVFKKTVTKTNTLLIDNAEAGKKTMVVWYYAGHGVMQGTTKAVCDRAANPR